MNWEGNNVHRGWIQGYRKKTMYTEGRFRVTGSKRYTQRVLKHLKEFVHTLQGASCP
jgi:hypothetical protein